MTDNALTRDDQHELNNKNSESCSSFESCDFESRSIFEQFLCFSPPNSVQASDSSSDPEYLPSKQRNKSLEASSLDEPYRRTTRLSTFKDETSTDNFSPLPQDPEYLPPKGILNALKKSIKDSVPQSDIITNVKQRKLRRTKKSVPACRSCWNHEKPPMSCNKARKLPPDLGMSSSPFSTEQLRQILEDSIVEEVVKDNTQKVPPEEVLLTTYHDQKEKEPTVKKDKPLKMPRTRSSLKLKPKKDEGVEISIPDTTIKSNEVSDISSQYKVSKDKVLPKTYVDKESKKVPKKRKRQTCRKQFRHKDITLYKLGAEPKRSRRRGRPVVAAAEAPYAPCSPMHFWQLYPDPVSETTQKSHVIQKIFLRRSSVNTPPSTPQGSKGNKHEEVSENLSSNANIINGDDKCYENFTAIENNNPPTSDLNNSNKIYCSSISIENNDMSKVPKVTLTPINNKDNVYQKSANLEDNKEVPQLQIQHDGKKDLVGQSKTSEGKHNLPIRIPERRTSIAEPLRTPPAPNNKVPSFPTECQTEYQFHKKKLEIKTIPPEIHQKVILVKPPISQDITENQFHKKKLEIKPISPESHQRVIPVKPPISQDITEKSKEDMIEVSASSLVKKSLESPPEFKGNGNLPVPKHIEKIVPKEVFTAKPRESADTFSDCRNLSIKVVKSCSGITDPLKLHKTCNLPKKIDNDTKGKANSITPPNRQVEDPSQTTSPISSHELSHKNSPILQQNLLNGPVSKSDIFRNNFHNRTSGNVPLNTFNSEMSAYALNTLAMNHLRTSHNSPVSSVSRNMPIIEETNQPSNDNYETFPSTSPFAIDSSKRNKKPKRKLSRSDTFDEIAPKVPRSNNYSNYPGYNYALSFYSATPPNPPFPPFPLPIPHSVYNMGPPVYPPKPNTNGQPSTFDRSGFRNIIPQNPMINPFLAHDPRLPSSPTYSPSNPPISKPYDPHMHYNHFVRFNNSIFVNPNTLPPDYSFLGMNNRKLEGTSQNSILNQGFNYPSKRNTPRHSPQQIFTVPESPHRREINEPQNTPLALVKNSVPPQCQDWNNIPIASRNEELTITKVPLPRENFPKGNHISEQASSPGNQKEVLTTHSKPADFRQNDGSTCSIVAISKGNTKYDSSGHPCNVTNGSDRRSGVGSVLHGELANVSISIIKNKNEKPKNVTSVSQKGLLPILERAKLLQGEQNVAISETTKALQNNFFQPYPAIAQNVQPSIVTNLQKNIPMVYTTAESNIQTTVQNIQSRIIPSLLKNNPKLYTTTAESVQNIQPSIIPNLLKYNLATNSTAPEGNKNIQNIQPNRKRNLKVNKRNVKNNQIHEKSENCSVSKATPSDFFRDVELEINSTRITKPIDCNASRNDPLGNNTELENKICLSRKIDQNTSQLNNFKTCAMVNTEKKLTKDNPPLITDYNLKPTVADKTVEAINLSINKPAEVAPIVCLNDTIPTPGTVSSSTCQSPKPSNINNIASMMQNIIHEGDVRKFDQYVETLRRSIENRDVDTLDAIKQSFTEELLKNVGNDTKNRKSEPTDNSSYPPTSKPSESSGTTSPSKTVGDLVPSNLFENTKDCQSLELKLDENIIKSPVPDNTEISQEKEIPPLLSPLGSQHEVTSESIPTTTALDRPVTPDLTKSSESEQNTTLINIKLSLSEPTAVQVTQREDIDTKSLEKTEDSRNDTFSQSPRESEEENVKIVEELKKTEDSRNAPFSQCPKESEEENVKIVEELKKTEDSRNATLSQSPRESEEENVKIVEELKKTEDSRNATFSQCPRESEGENVKIVEELSTGIGCQTNVTTYPENINDVTPTQNSSKKTLLEPSQTLNSVTIPEFMDIEIKKELIIDDDCYIVSVHRLTEDKGIQADIPESPINTHANYRGGGSIRKRKKWKFLEGSKLHKRRRQRKPNFQSRNRRKRLLNKQYQPSQYIRNKTLENTKMKTKKVSNNIRAKPYQRESNKVDESKNSISTSTESFQNKSSSEDCSRISKATVTISTKPFQTTPNADPYEDGYQISKISLGKKSVGDDDTELIRTMNGSLSGNVTTIPTKQCPDESQMSETSTTALAKPSQINQPPGDYSPISTNTKISADGSDISETSCTVTSNKPSDLKPHQHSVIGSRSTSIATSTRPYRGTTNRRPGVRKKRSKPTAVNKRISKRLLLKRGRNKSDESCSISKPDNPLVTSPNNEEVNVAPSNVVCEPEVSALHNLKNADIIQNRCFVRLSRILENASVNESDSNANEEISSDKVEDAQTVGAIQTAQEGEVSAKTSGRQECNCGHTNGQTETFSNDQQTLSLSSSHCSDSGKLVNNGIDLTEDTSSLPDTNQDLDLLPDSSQDCSLDKNSKKLSSSSLPIKATATNRDVNEDKTDFIQTPPTLVPSIPRSVVIPTPPTLVPSIPRSVVIPEDSSEDVILLSDDDQSDTETTCGGEIISPNHNSTRAIQNPPSLNKSSPLGNNNHANNNSRPLNEFATQVSTPCINSPEGSGNKSENCNSLGIRDPSPLPSDSGVTLRLNESGKYVTYSREKNCNQSVNKTQQFDVPRVPSINNDKNELPPFPAPVLNKTSSRIVENTTGMQSDATHINNFFLLPQPSQNKIPQHALTSSPNTSVGSSRDNQTTSAIATPQKSPTVPESYNTYNPMQLPGASSIRMLPPDTVGYPNEIPEKSLPPQNNFNSQQYQAPISYKGARPSVTSPQVSGNNPQNTFLNRTFPLDYNTPSNGNYRCITNNESVTNKSVHVSPKPSAAGSMFQQTFNNPTDFYQSAPMGYQNNNLTSMPQQPSPSYPQISPSYPQVSPTYPQASSTFTTTSTIPQKPPSVGRTSYQISKTPPTAHRRVNNNNDITVTSDSLEVQQPALLNTSGPVASDPYGYRSRNSECEIDLTMSSKSAHREDGTNVKKSSKGMDPKILRRNHSSEDGDGVLAPDPYQLNGPRHADGVNFQLYPHYPQKINGNPSQVQSSFTDSAGISYPTGQGQNSSNSQFLPNFRQSTAMLNKLSTKISNPKIDIQAKHKDLVQISARHHIPGQAFEQCQSQSCVPDPRENRVGDASETGGLHKKRSKEDQNYVNMKAYDQNLFNGNPDYGFFQSLTKNTPSSFETGIYRPNPPRYNESNSFHKYGGISNTSQQHAPMNMREAYHHQNLNAIPPATQSNGSNSTYTRQTCKVPSNSGTHLMANFMQNKMLELDAAKVNDILDKLRNQPGTLNPEQYVFAMNVLEKEGCPFDFLDFYTFVTKKQIANSQMPISFGLFLEFQNAGRLKSFECAFRVYSMRHEKEKSMMLKPT